MRPDGIPTEFYILVRVGKLQTFISLDSAAELRPFVEARTAGSRPDTGCDVHWISSMPSSRKQLHNGRYLT